MFYFSFVKKQNQIPSFPIILTVSLGFNIYNKKHSTK